MLSPSAIFHRILRAGVVSVVMRTGVSPGTLCATGGKGLGCYDHQIQLAELRVSGIRAARRIARRDHGLTSYDISYKYC